MIDFCYDNMEHFATYQCEQHEDRFQCPDCLIHYFEEHDRFAIIIHDGGGSFMTINFCPWCGKKFQEDGPKRMIDVVGDFWK